jgi:hypothetical protein
MQNRIAGWPRIGEETGQSIPQRGHNLGLTQV